MAPKTKELRKINEFLKDMASQIKSDKLHDEDKISLPQMMSILEDNVEGEEEEEEEDQPCKTRKQRGKLIKQAIKCLPRLKAMAVARIENQSAANSKKGNGDMMRYFLPCSPLGCNVCGKVRLTLEDAQEHRAINHETYTFPCDLASCGSIYESQHEKNRHMKKH